MAGTIVGLVALLLVGCTPLDQGRGGAQHAVPPPRAMETAVSPQGTQVALFTPTPGLEAAPRFVSPSPSPTPRPSPMSSPSPVPSPSPSGQVAAPPVEEALEVQLWRTPPSRDLRALHQRLVRQSPPSSATPRAADPQAGAPRLGERRSFWIADHERSSYFEVSATLRGVSPDAYFFIEDGYELSETAIEEAVAAFSYRIAPQVREYFGSEWSPGIDGDPHIVVLHAAIPGPPGYFSSNDEYSRSVVPYSNEHEMIYVNLRGLSLGSASYLATLAHEFQHMIHWNNDLSEDTWVNEGLSELATRLAGFGVSSLASFVSAPDTQLTTWDENPVQAVPHYGASYAFFSYLAEHYGGYGALKDLVSVKKHGAAGVEEFLRARGYGVSFDRVFQDWVVANLVDDPALDGGRYGYRDLDIGLVPKQLSGPPLRESGSVRQYAADYVELPPEGDLDVSFVGKSRVKLIPNEPHSGRGQWWSNRGDVMDTTLTREFDLAELTRATLRAWLWFDIEKHFDYAYVEASSDGGQTWTILPGQHTTTLNPNGNSLGPAYTGKSGGGDSPAWIQDEYDLTPYAGKRVLIRFEYVTDDANNGDGFAVDDVSIAELGYVHDAEAGGEWIAEGFIRTENYLDQDYVVQLVTLGEESAVEVLPLDAERKGRWHLNGSGGRRRVLVISALAPATTQEAPYELSIR